MQASSLPTETGEGRSMDPWATCYGKTWRACTCTTRIYTYGRHRACARSPSSINVISWKIVDYDKHVVEEFTLSRSVWRSRFDVTKIPHYMPSRISTPDVKLAKFDVIGAHFAPAYRDHRNYRTADHPRKQPETHRDGPSQPGWNVQEDGAESTSMHLRGQLWIGILIQMDNRQLHTYIRAVQRHDWHHNTALHGPLPEAEIYVRRVLIDCTYSATSLNDLSAVCGKSCKHPDAAPIAVSNPITCTDRPANQRCRYLDTVLSIYLKCSLNNNQLFV
ncbi:uncharacterized protein H6S33_009256 [Morchella sextelata]|uniref:uncharacterized protein n=1 Tax=Morchella sextelata TaxID=1174677 RepID=UPI001D0445BA|nr:uncharacterized protein H6S33_009256 [Morchella sextelata]KAH0612876.1 hypothetical protein H6S33_009256 [Morchella sextelata]